jgi:polyhydroxyalkanoate synthesis regulator phasin
VKLLGFLIFFVGFVIGAVAVETWKNAMIELMKYTHKKEMDEIFEEVKRLRAQVATLIGKE